MNAYAIIMAGGNGERFWPLSTPEKPKQFLDLFGGKPLIRQALDRLEGLIPPERVFVITAERFVARTRAALDSLPPENVMGEPCRRDTAAAVASACGLVLARGGADAVGCILTADQIITPPEAFRATLADALAAANDAIVTMGIVPTRPETAYGYIRRGPRHAFDGPTVFHEVQRFVEKPDAATALGYVASGEYLWNSGMFIWRAGTMRDAFRRHAPDLVTLVDALAAAPDPAAAMAAAYPALRSISIDFAVMEKAERILVAESRFAWDDVGSWNAIANHFPADNAGNVALGRVTLTNCRATTVVSDADHVVAVAGLEDAVVVHTPAATLVCAKRELSSLKNLVRSVLEP